MVSANALANSQRAFQSLGLVVVDEQHKFGVNQRANLRNQDETTPQYLVMTATPIPRTISMTVYGDLDVSTLRSAAAEDGKATGSSPINSYLGDESNRDEWWAFFRKKLDEGRQGYVVAPQVDSGKSETASVEALFEALTNGPLEAYRLDLLHGRQKSDEKLRIMHAFARGHTQVLVATSVVEVGIDVPNASVMTIESAERWLRCTDPDGRLFSLLCMVCVLSGSYLLFSADPQPEPLYVG